MLEQRFQSFYARNYDDIYSLALCYVSDRHEAEDLTQEIFSRAWERLGAFRGTSSLATWIYRIGINTARNYIKARNRRPPDVDVQLDEENWPFEEELTDYQNPEQINEEAELEHKLYISYYNLPDKLRKSFFLWNDKGLKYKDIAKITGLPVGTIRSRIARARTFLYNNTREVV